METNSTTITTQFHRRIDDALRLNGAKPDEGAGPAPNLVARSVQSFAETLRAAETTAIDGMMGRADPQSVVTALANAEIAVQSAVTIRDKVVESYQEILRMPV